jgi:hypothetical protein
VKMGVEGQRLTAEDQLFILMQAGLYLSSTRGFSSPELRNCYESAEPLCHSLYRPAQVRLAQVGLIRLMFESLFIPSLNALLEQRKVGCLCH